MNPIASAISEPLTFTLAHFVWEGTLIGLLTALVALGFRGRSPQARYTVYLIGMLVMVACLPLTFAFVSMTSPTTTGNNVEVTSPSAISQEKNDHREFADPPIANPPLVDFTQRPVLPSVAESAAGVSLDARENPPEDTVASPSESSWLLRLSPYVAGAYWMGLTVMLLRIAVSLYGGHRLRQEAVALSGQELEIVPRAANRIGLCRVPFVGTCRRLSGPVVIGILRPVVLLPATLVSGLTPQQLETVLTHEFTHLRRYDHWVLMFQRLAEALLFFHPAVWSISRGLSNERENCCDDAVIAAGTPRVAYAELLVKIAEQRTLSHPTVTALAASGGKPSRLRLRVLRLLDPPAEPRLRLGRSQAIGIPGLLAAFVLVPVLANVLAQSSNTNKEGRQVVRADQSAPDEIKNGPMANANENLPGKASANKPPKFLAKISRTAPKEPAIVWGDPVGGLAVGIGDVSTSLKSPVRPIITAYLENRGPTTIESLLPYRTSFILELDGQFFAEADFGGPVHVLKPGERIGNITITTSAFHNVKDLKSAQLIDQTKPGPELSDGEHTLRVHFGQAASSTIKFKASLSPYPIDEAVAMIVKELEDVDRDVRRNAAWAAGKLHLAGCRDALEAVLDDNDKVIRRYAAESLGKIGDPASTQSLRGLLKDDQMEVRLAAAESLVELGVPLETKWVEPVIKSKDPVFQNAIWLVRRHGGKAAVPALIRCLDVKDPAVNNYYNYTLVWQIHACGGPDLKYHHDFDNNGTPEEVEENRQVLSKLIESLKKPGNDDAEANNARDINERADQLFATKGPATLTTAFSPNGKHVAVGHALGKISIYDVETGKLKATWNGHFKNVTSLSYDPLGNSLVSGGSDKVLRVWNPATGKERLSYTYNQRVTSVVFSPDGKSVFAGTGYRGGVVYRVDLEKKTSTEVFNERTSIHAGTDSPEIRNLAISRDGKTLAVAVFRGIVLIDLKTNTELRVLPEDESVAIRHCCFSPDGRTVASASKIITLWNPENGETRQRLNREWKRGTITSIQFSPDGNHLIAGIDGGEAFSSEVVIWKTGDEKPTAILDTGTFSLKDVKLTPDGKQLLTCHAGGLKFWDFGDTDNRRDAEIRLIGDQVTVEALDRLAGKHWRKVSLRDAKFDGAIIEKLRESASIQTLELTGTGLSGQLPRLGHINNLSGLIIGERLTGHDLEALGELSNLTSLSFTQSFTINRAGAHELARLTNLKSLSLYNINLDDSAFAELKALNRLEALDLSHTRITDEGLAPIASMPRLRTLELYRHPAWHIKQQLTDKSVRQILKLTKLERLSLSGEVTDEGFQKVLQLPNLKSISITGTNVTAKGLSALQQSKVSSLSLSSSQLGPFSSLPQDASVEEILQQVPGLANLRKSKNLRQVHVHGPPSRMADYEIWQRAVPEISWLSSN